jgi:hypothetical protein
MDGSVGIVAPGVDGGFEDAWLIEGCGVTVTVTVTGAGFAQAGTAIVQTASHIKRAITVSRGIPYSILNIVTSEQYTGHIIQIDRGKSKWFMSRLFYALQYLDLCAG